MNRPPHGTGGPTSVVVVGGGQNCEHDVSLASAASVAAALDPERFRVTTLTIGRDGRWLDGAGAPLRDGLVDALSLISDADVVFPAVHGPTGEDGTLAGLWELAEVAYVGSGVRAGALAMDKWATKLIAESLGIRTAGGLVVDAESTSAAAAVDLPVVVKPVAAGSSHGVRRVDDRRDLAGAIDEALGLDDRVLVEEVVVGREIDIGVLGLPDGSLFVGPPLEIVVADGSLFDTEKKYDGSADFRLPAQLDPCVVAQLGEAAKSLFRALGCAGVARFDFFLTADGLVLNEVNTMPGMTAQSQVPKMFEAVGLTYSQLLGSLVDAALAGGSAR